jgi:bifunctional DNA-binding transcriptional regulator/antitoxin component of YhaV-PrlF toxin-antitoxin module
METVTVSSKYQVVIPETLRRDGKIRPGIKMAVIVKHGILYFVPVRPFGEAKGMIPGLSSRGMRDETDRT